MDIPDQDTIDIFNKRGRQKPREWYTTRTKTVYRNKNKNNDPHKEQAQIIEMVNETFDTTPRQHNIITIRYWLHKEDRNRDRRNDFDKPWKRGFTRDDVKQLDISDFRIVLARCCRCDEWGIYKTDCKKCGGDVSITSQVDNNDKPNFTTCSTHWDMDRKCGKVAQNIVASDENPIATRVIDAWVEYPFDLDKQARFVDYRFNYLGDLKDINMAILEAVDLRDFGKALIICESCGQWVARNTNCKHCGYYAGTFDDWYGENCCSTAAP